MFSIGKIIREPQFCKNTSQMLRLTALTSDPGLILAQKIGTLLFPKINEMIAWVALIQQGSHNIKIKQETQKKGWSYMQQKMKPVMTISIG